VAKWAFGLGFDGGDTSLNESGSYTIDMKTNQLRRAFCRTCLLALAVILVCGCGDGRPKRVPVSGQILIDGAPLAAGTDGFIRIEPADGRAATGRIDPNDGTFTLSTYESEDGCIEGTHAVAVIVNATLPGRVVSLIPEHYGETETSELTVTIDGPTDSLRIELSGPLQSMPTGAGTDQGDDPGPL